MDPEPANVLVDASRRPCLTDVGLARDVTRELGESLAVTGNILGTPAFMSLEQARGEPKTLGLADEDLAPLRDDERWSRVLSRPGR